MDSFFSFDARITRLRLVSGLLLALALAWGGVLMLRTGIPAIIVAVGALGGVVLAKLLTEAVRRRHDMGSSGTAAAVLFAGGAAVTVAVLAYALLSGAIVLFYATLVLLAFCWAALLLRHGQAGANIYGPALPRPLLPAFGERRGSHGLTTAIVLILLGVATGYAGARWIEGLQDRRVFEERQAEAIQAAGNNAAPTELEKIYQERNGSRLDDDGTP